MRLVIVGYRTRKRFLRDRVVGVWVPVELRVLKIFALWRIPSLRASAKPFSSRCIVEDEGWFTYRASSMLEYPSTSRTSWWKCTMLQQQCILCFMFLSFEMTTSKKGDTMCFMRFYYVARALIWRNSIFIARVPRKSKVGEGVGGGNLLEQLDARHWWERTASSLLAGWWVWRRCSWLRIYALKGMNNVIMPRMGFGSEFDEMLEGGLTNGRTVFFYDIDFYCVNFWKLLCICINTTIFQNLKT